MAVIYLSSVDGSDSDNGSTWALAKATLAAALTAAGAGGTVYVDHAHAETQTAAMTLTSPGTAASPVTVLCVDRTGNPEPPTALATTATVSTTSTGALNFGAGYTYSYGVTYTTALNLNFTATTDCFWKIEQGGLSITGASSASRIVTGSTASAHNERFLHLLNATLTLSHVSQRFNCLGTPILWEGGALAGSAPAVLFDLINQGYAQIIDVVGVDLSTQGSGDALVGFGNATQGYGRVTFLGCKLGSSVAAATGTGTGQAGTEIRLINSDSADTNHRYHYQVYQGTITSETTIKRTGGASDGVTGFSRKFVTTANSKFYSPLCGPWFKFWNETPGSVTVEIETVTDNVTLTNAEAWVDVQYMGTSGFPLGLFANDRAADILATPANQTSSSETWTTTGLGTPVKQKMAVTFTTAERGWVMARLCVAKASTTVYACPKILASSYKQTMDPDGSIHNAVKLPTEAQVEDGEFFGADGTEFEGTFVGGGGPAPLASGAFHQQWVR